MGVDPQKEKGRRYRRPLDFSNLAGFGLLSGLRHWENRNKGAAFQAFVELHLAFAGCEDGVVFTNAHVGARPHLGTALTHDDVARNDDFATVFLYTKATTG